MVYVVRLCETASGSSESANRLNTCFDALCILVWSLVIFGFMLKHDWKSETKTMRLHVHVCVCVGGCVQPGKASSNFIYIVLTNAKCKANIALLRPTNHRCLVRKRTSRFLQSYPYCKYGLRSWVFPSHGLYLTRSQPVAEGITGQSIPTSTIFRACWLKHYFEDVFLEFSLPNFNGIVYRYRNVIPNDWPYHTSLATSEKMDAVHFSHRLQRLCKSLPVAYWVHLSALDWGTLRPSCYRVHWPKSLYGSSWVQLWKHPALKLLEDCICNPAKPQTG